MTKKGKKRQLIETESNEHVLDKVKEVGKNLPKKKKLKTDVTNLTEKKIAENSHLVKDGVSKKKKLKTNKNNSATEKVAEHFDLAQIVAKKKKSKNNLSNVPGEKKQDIEAPNNGLNTEKQSKKLKKKKKLQKLENSLSNEDSEDKVPAGNTVESAKTDKGKKDLSSKRKEFFKNKRKDALEQRKVIRQEEGQFSAVDKLSLEDMKKRIAEIQSRETLSKTALRKLRIFKKKVSVLEGNTDDSASPKRKRDSEEEQTQEHKNKKLKKNKPIKTDISNKTEKNGHTLTAEKKGKKNKRDEQVQKISPQENLFFEDRLGSELQNHDSSDSESEKNEKEFDTSKKTFKSIMKQQKPNAVEVFKVNDVSDVESDDENDSEIEEDDDQINKIESEENSEQNSDDEDSEEDSIIEKKSKNELIINKKVENSSSNDETAEESETAEPEDSEDDSNDSSPKEEEEKNTPFAKKFANQKHTNENTQSAKNQRYVLFIGNLAYDATTVDIKKHFLTKVDKVKDVRIPLNPGSNTPRGFAYVEVENSTDFEKGLSLHDTFIKGRKINVQYTKSGSKNVNNRQDIVHKNKKLHAMRRAGKLAGSKKEDHKRSFRRNNKNFKNKT